MSEGELTTLNRDPEKYGVPVLVLKYVVKKVKGKAYVYLQGREKGGRVRTIYIGPLERIVKAYLAMQGIDEESLRNSGPAGIRTPDLRRVSDFNAWVDGRILYVILPSINYTRSNCVEITQGLLRRFRKWLINEEGTGERSANDYVAYLRKALGIKLCGKEDVSRVFEAMGSVNDRSYKSFRRFLTFLEKKLDGYDDLVTKLLKALPKPPKVREDTYVPPDSMILEVRDRVKASGDTALKLFYNILVSTGCRGTEARYLIQNISRLRVVDLGEYVRVHVDLQRGSKNEFVMYLPKEVYQQLKEFRGRLKHRNNMEKDLKDAGLSVKYFRKWWRQLAKRLEIDSEDIEAFQGRPRSIGARHYTDWIPILDKDYSRMLTTLKTFLILEDVTKPQVIG